ncbi:MAG: hypothetical protein O3A63_15920 [Proteobacteria bacterium]|nr:hypothetical protein [Pseudomonadota bacterium]
MLKALFDMLSADRPVLNEFPVTLDSADSQPLVCSLPPRLDPDEHPAVDEARAIRNAYERSVAANGNRIGVGREISVDAIPSAIEAFVRIENGVDWKAAGIPGNPMRVAQDIRGYYQSAALSLTSSRAHGWAGENWFYENTETGRLMLRVRSVLKEGGAPQPLWFYLSPGDR